MKLISINGETTLEGLDDASIRKFAEGEASFVFAAITMGGGSQERRSLEASLEKYFETLPQQDADHFIATFEQAFSVHMKAMEKEHVARKQQERRSEIKRALIFWGPVVAAILLYFIFKH